MVRKNFYLVGLDTETCNSYIDEKGRVRLDDSLTYDIGWQITDRRGNIYRQRSFVVKEIFVDCAEIVAEAFFKEKIPQYKKELAEGSRKLASIWEIRRTLINDMIEFNTNIVFAHNARFDLNALNKTVRYISSSFVRHFFKYDTVIWDTMKMCDVICEKKSYQKFCEQNGFMTANKTPRPQKKAEVLYAYLTNNPNFEESHTGLEDVIIETEILAQCFRQHKKMNRELFPKN